MQYVTLFKFVEILIDTTGATLLFETDLPGISLTVRATGNIPTTSGRHPYRMTLPGITKGKLYRVTVQLGGLNTARIYSCRVYARILGPAPTPWAWYPVPVLETPVEWQPMKLPIEPTSEEWQAMKLPIEPTSDAWTEVKLPIVPTPVLPEWVPIPVDK